MDNGYKQVSFWVYLAIVLSGAILQIKLVNRAMEVYNQAEIGPIYSSALILMNMFSGIIILDEKTLYTP
jgi:hypothetical protein